MSTKKKPDTQEKKKVYCFGCKHLSPYELCLCLNTMTGNAISPHKQCQWAHAANKNNDCPYFEEKPKPKVFCGKCRNYSVLETLSEQGWSEGFKKVCGASENRQDTYHSPKSEYARKPSEINANNDCPWYREKPYVEITVGDKFREMQENLDKFKLTMKAGAAILSEIAPKRPWWKFWQKAGA